MSSKNTSPLLSVRPWFGASIQAPSCGEDFGFLHLRSPYRLAAMAMPVIPHTERFHSAVLETIGCEAAQANRWLKCQPSSYVRLKAYGFVGLSEGHRIDPETGC